ncbi:MAG: methyltransferase domain-containing protein [Gammaproteobacteria bacterium]|nr:methyltransferase domain-containing protein [Gammaproteobacteria bacterium]MDH5652372.1 methyltransferase domain-containing protein [Gammaproteobacteria bacterium]
MSEEKKSPVDHFSARAPEWHLLYAKPAFRQRFDLFLSGVESVAQPPAKILDFGCGAGVMATELARRGYNVTGVDAASGMVEAATRYATEQNISNIKFYQTDTVGDTLPKNEFDIVICSSVLEYVERDTTLTQNLVAAIKPGGHLYISVPNSRSIIGKLEDIVSRLGFRKRGNNNADVFFAHKRYAAGEFASLLKKFGMRDIQHAYFECPFIGKLGWLVSKSSLIGVMNLTSGRKGD